MRRFLLALLSVSALPVTVAAAQDALPASLPPEIAERIAARPDRFAGMAVDLIHGHGQGGAIDAVAIDRAIALDRAFFRARAVRPFLESDLDADGTATAAEVTARAATLSAPARIRLLRDWDSADADADGTLSPAELRAHAETSATRAVSPQDESMMRAILAFDADSDGRVTTAEIRAATDAMTQG